MPNLKQYERLEVWYSVPMKGMYETLEEASSMCERCDFDSDLMIVPVVVGIFTDDSYERI